MTEEWVKQRAKAMTRQLDPFIARGSESKVEDVFIDFGQQAFELGKETAVNDMVKDAADILREHEQDFSKYPVTIAEHRANHAHLWSPREALINILRDIDAGNLNPSAMVVCIQETDPEDEHRQRSSFRAVSPNLHTSLGLVEMVKHDLICEGGGE